LREIGAAEEHPDLYLILGIDAYRDIDTWYRAGELLALANVIVTTRPGQAFPSGGPEPPVAAREACCYDPGIGCYLHESGHVLVGHRIDGINVSASEIRSRVREGLPIDHLTGAEVARYIRGHRLYGDAGR
jgi:nicotinate-nucleotide adenylyltransferase